MTRVGSIGIGTLCALVFAAPSALAQGVHVDPDSPSAREYALPLEAARRQAHSSNNPARRVNLTERTAPLFGEGVGEEAAPATARARSRVRSGKSGASGPGTGERVASGRASEIVAAAAQRPPTPAGGGPLPLLIAGGALLTAAGIGLGAWLRRRSG